MFKIHQCLKVKITVMCADISETPNRSAVNLDMYISAYTLQKLRTFGSFFLLMFEFLFVRLT